MGSTYYNELLPIYHVCPDPSLTHHFPALKCQKIMLTLLNWRDISLLGVGLDLMPRQLKVYNLRALQGCKAKALADPVACVSAFQTLQP